MSTPPSSAMDINEVFRGGARSVEFLDRLNQASIVMLAETAIVPRPVAARIARGIAELMAQERVTPPTRSADYLEYEPRLTAIVGPDASRLHTGRSRQDIASAIARMNLRDGLIRVYEALVTAREKLIAVAERHTETIIPAYTHGVQAQPTTFAHYLLAFEAALGRETERLQQVYARVNRNPLGAAALATSSFPLDRARLAALLGFAGLLENAYDANHLAPVDSALDVASVYSIVAIHMGQFAQDIHAQYAEPEPWFMLRAGDLMGVSSIMPQKRNPAALEQLRAQASIVIAEAHIPFMLSHNARTGMFDYRSYDPVPCAKPLQILKLFQQVVENIVVNRERALAEVRADYSTTTEIADALAQKADVPFRIGHHFASRLTDYGRGKSLKLHEIPYAEAARIYAAEAGQAFPLGETDFAHIISAEFMVYGRRGTGGPQVAETKRMLSEAGDSAATARAWVTDRSAALAHAQETLEQAFAGLASVS